MVCTTPVWAGLGLEARAWAYIGGLRAREEGTVEGGPTALREVSLDLPSLEPGISSHAAAEEGQR